MKKNIKMYYTETCPYCRMAEDLLVKIGVDQVKKINIEDNPEYREEMIGLTGKTSVPQIFIGSNHVGGCDDLYDAHESGVLSKLLSDID